MSSGDQTANSSPQSLPPPSKRDPFSLPQQEDPWNRPLQQLSHSREGLEQDYKRGGFQTLSRHQLYVWLTDLAPEQPADSARRGDNCKIPMRTTHKCYIGCKWYMVASGCLLHFTSFYFMLWRNKFILLNNQDLIGLPWLHQIIRLFHAQKVKTEHSSSCADCPCKLGCCVLHQ